MHVFNKILAANMSIQYNAYKINFTDSLGRYLDLYPQHINHEFIIEKKTCSDKMIIFIYFTI